MCGCGLVVWGCATEGKSGCCVAAGVVHLFFTWRVGRLVGSVQRRRLGGGHAGERIGRIRRCGHRVHRHAGTLALSGLRLRRHRSAGGADLHVLQVVLLRIEYEDVSALVL